MPDDPYSLSDLALLADVTPRTIRYYVAEGLLPSPAAAGPATRYTEGHLLRLRLIKRLQAEHISLIGIRKRLEGLTDDEIAAVLEVSSRVEPEPDRGADSTLAFVRDLMAKASVAPRFHDRPAPEPPPSMSMPQASGPAPSSPPAAAPAPSVASRALRLSADLDEPAFRRRALLPSAPASLPGPQPPRPASSDRSTWERIPLSPDVELHVRRPMERHAGKRVEKLIQIALDLFRDGP